jgi:large subunit ribosomal protein L14
LEIYTHISDVIIAMVMEVIQNVFFKNLELVMIIIIHIYKKVKSKNGMNVQFNDNAIVIINQEWNPKWISVFGLVVQELWESDFTKIGSLAPKYYK